MVDGIKPYLANIEAYAITNLYWTNLSFEKPSKLPVVSDENKQIFNSYKIDWFDDWRTGLITLKSNKRFNYAKINDAYYFLDVDKYLGRDPAKLIRYKVTWDVWVNDVLRKDIHIEGILAKTLDLDLVYSQLPNVSPITQGCNRVKYLPVSAGESSASIYIPPLEITEGVIKNNWFVYKVTKKFKEKVREITKEYENKQPTDSESFFIKGVELTKIKAWQYEVFSELSNWFSDPHINKSNYSLAPLDNTITGFYQGLKNEFREALGAEKLFAVIKKDAKGLGLTQQIVDDVKLGDIDLSSITDILNIYPIDQLMVDENQNFKYLGKWQETKEDDLDNYVIA